MRTEAALHFYPTDAGNTSGDSQWVLGCIRSKLRSFELQDSGCHVLYRL